MAEPSADDAARVAQAMGMVSVQADCTVDEALLLIHDRAIVEGMTMHEIASQVVARRIRFGE
jgi:AmiR/NasT family two-component response regulator